MLRSRLVLIAAGVLVSACAPAPPPPDATLVTQWLRAQLVLVRAERINTPAATRVSAYGGIAMYEGYVAGSKSLRSLGGQLNGLGPMPKVPVGGPVDGAIAAAAAERVVLGELFKDGFATTKRAIDSIAEAQIVSRVKAGVGEAARRRSEEHGRAIGSTIAAWAAADSFAVTRGRPYEPPKGRQYWENTVSPDQFVSLGISAQSDMVLTGNSAAAADAERATERSTFVNRPKNSGKSATPAANPGRPMEPYWGTFRTYAIPNASVCPLPRPPEYSEKAGSPFYEMAKVTWDTARALTEVQRKTALFWADNPILTGTPAFHWFSVLSQVIPARHLDAERAAELVALTSISIADVFITAWREKYTSMVVRPVTYIRRVWDPKFQTVVPTPPFPEYPSGHSTQSGAATYVITRFLGDTMTFVDSTQADIGQPPRTYHSFAAARDEVAISRLYGGIHYMPAIREGVTHGECVAKLILERVRTRSGS